MKPEDIDAIVNELCESYFKGLDTNDDFLKKLNEMAAPFVDADGKVNYKDLLPVFCSFSISESVRTSAKITAEALKRLLA